ncbi:homogentisate 1,2-dioxygenase [Marinoscillum sp. MHG1-6]|uniref:homogentisate 1,2-dioxygenase n=1 Tax=Marinoscillum sp. MHG1-6 TaxID=2959627 RepID=UPI00215876B2|nr:homogentisate 1,2-dioxygenase [Marinoscillum sp. MHG1-6]
MPFYHKVGEIPRVKHTTFYQPDGKTLYREELVSSKGFSGIYSTIYHHFLPTAVKSVKELGHREDDWPEAPALYYHCYTDKSEKKGNFITARETFLKNHTCKISCARVTEDTNDFYRNGGGAEYLFIHHGTGAFYSQYGKNTFGPGDQIVVPRATTYQLKFDDFKNNKLLIIESDTAFEIPNHYKNEYGQMTEHAPYSERDFRPPEYTEPKTGTGDFRIVVKMKDRFFEHIVPHHPFGAIGWDGFLYPFTFNIKDYHPKVGRIHLPPPVHLLYKTRSFVVCNFVPRLFDFHESAVPAPYFHSNIDSDEVLYYVEGDFMSRKGVEEGSITLHPGGMPHGPQPGKTEASIGARKTEEYAVMIDTYEALQPTLAVKKTIDKDYAKSWL